MHPVLIIGAGKIGSAMAQLLAVEDIYPIHLADQEAKILSGNKNLPTTKRIIITTLDVHNVNQVSAYIAEHGITALISCLPFHLTVIAARIARKCQIHYFDFTEDVATTAQIQEIAKDANTAFVSQCGVAPGFINIIANDLMQTFMEVDTVKLRAGALPAITSHPLHYALTWSTEGVINEYANPCYGIHQGTLVTLQPLHDLEMIDLDGCRYEAFNTSGGIGSLIKLYKDRVKYLDYKTIRYLGHCEIMRFLMEDLKLSEDRVTLKKLLESNIPKTFQDVVIIYISVSGIKQGEFIEESYCKKIYPKLIDGVPFSAIQIATCAGAAGVIDKVLTQAQRDSRKYSGYFYQETIFNNDFLTGRFGKYFL